MLSCFLHCRRLVARTLPFQGGEAGSIPVDSTNFGDAATMVEWPRTVNPVLKKRNRFESYHLHQVLVCSYRGYYCGLSIHLRGFDSPTDRQVYVGVRRTARQRIANPHNAGSNPVTHSK